MSKRPGISALERSSERSLYEQITDRLRSHVLSRLGPGSKLPTEAELMEQFSVSRSTVRKAIKELVNEGTLVARQGKGTFVAQRTPKIVHAIDKLAPFIETFQKAGVNPSTEVISFEWVDNPELPAELEAWERPILRYQRMYRSQGVPHAITEVCVLRSIGNQISRADSEAYPIYDILRSKCGVELAQSEFLVSCRQPSAAIAQKLEISPSGFLLVLQRITRDVAQNPVEMTTHYLRPDVYQLSVALSNLAN